MIVGKSAQHYSGKAVSRAAERAADAPIELRVPADMNGLRLDQALARLLPTYSRSRLQQWVRSARVLVDGAARAPKDKLWGGERIEVRVEGDSAREDMPQNIPLAIIFEDAQLLVIDKPAGLVVHPGSGNLRGTLLNALLHHAPALAALPRAGIVHRLDKDTSGLLVVAKTLEAHASLVRQLQARSVRREYLAVVAGVPAPHGQVDAPIGRHPVARTKMAVVARGKPALTHFRVRRAGAKWALVQCRLETGRTHQIRVHMRSIGHPLLGDPVYGNGKLPRNLPDVARGFPRQALHAARLELMHPASGERLAFSAPLPRDLAELVAALERHARAS